MTINRIILFLFLMGNMVNNILAQNVIISNLNNPNEPTIMMDPNNPNILVAAANLNNYK